MSDGFEIEYNEDWVLFHQRLATFGEKVAKQVTLAALKETAAVMKSEAILYANRSEEVHKLKVKGVYIEISPGNLKKHIRFRKMRKPPEGELAYQVYIKPTIAWYAKFVEFGTSKMAASPFMRPAFEHNIDKMPRIFKEMVDMAILEGGLE